jgi:hypothetical protein
VAEAALLWAERYCQQSSLLLDTSFTRSAGDLAMHNTSHPCHNKVQVRILMGYLRRRLEQNGEKVCLN